MAAECDIIKLKAGALTPTDVYGARARTLADLIAADFNTTDAWAISVEGVRSIARSVFPSDWPFADRLRGGELFSLRSSPVVRAWGGPETLLNIGMTAAVRDKLAKTLGLEAANALYCRFVQDYAVQVMRLDEEEFEEILASVTDDTPDHTKMLAACLEYYEAEMDEPFPQDPIEQLQNAARSMASAWTGTSARILREAKGADPDAGLGLIAQQMVLGLGRGESGAGVGQFVSPVTGAVMAHGRYLSQGQGLDALDAGNDASFLGADKRGPSLETIAPEAFEQFRAAAELARKVFRDDMRLEFTVHDGEIFVLDAVPAERNSRAAVAIMVRLVEDGIITKREALLGIDPRTQPERNPAPADRPQGDARRGGVRHRRQPGRGHRTDRVYRHRRAGVESAQRALYSGACRNRARRYSRHALGRGCADRARRDHQPCRRRRTRSGPALRRRGLEP